MGLAPAASVRGTKGSCDLPRHSLDLTHLILHGIQQRLVTNEQFCLPLQKQLS